jgi:hypothetical protein
MRGTWELLADFRGTLCRISTIRPLRQGRILVAMSAAPQAPVHFPKVIVFDLDACLWFPEMDMLAGAPFKTHAEKGTWLRRSTQVLYLHQNNF